MYILIKESWVATLILDKVEFEAKKITRDKERHCMFYKGNPSRGRTVLSVYEPNNGASK